VTAYLCVTGRSINEGTANSIFTLLEFAQLQPNLKIIPDVRSSSDLVQLRSAVVTEWYDRAAEHDLFVFVDNDMIFEPMDFFRLLQCDGDVCGGLYSNGENERPNAVFIDLPRFLNGSTDELLSTGAGFTMIRKPILRKIIAQIKKEFGRSRVIGLQNQRYIPFFQEIIRPKVLVQEEESAKSREKQELIWFGEDYSFCYRVKRAGGTIKGFYSPTLGHEKTKKYFLPRVWAGKNERAASSSTSIGGNKISTVMNDEKEEL